jgi:hypothetical protein
LGARSGRSIGSASANDTPGRAASAARAASRLVPGVSRTLYMPNPIGFACVTPATAVSPAAAGVIPG